MDGTIKVWDASALETPLQTITDAHSSGVVCFVTYGDRLLTGGTDGALKVWRSAGPHGTFQLAYTVKEHNAPLWCIDVQEGYMTTGALDGSIKHWDFHGLRTLGIPHHSTSK